jgi:hypothetical protein
VLAVSTVVLLFAALPGAVRDAFETGDLYLVSQAFLDDLPRRLMGPGRMRFLFQPIVAITLGMMSRKRDVGHQLTNLFLFSVLLDLVAQWLILGVAHPGAALVVGPCLITLPYLAARWVANRIGTRDHTDDDRAGS